MTVLTTFLKNFFTGGLILGIVTTLINHFNHLKTIKLYGYLAGSSFIVTMYMYLFIHNHFSTAGTS